MAFLTLMLIATLLPPAPCVDNGMGLVPPLGWSTQHLGCHFDHSTLEDAAELLNKKGLSAKGYKFVNVGDCWQAKVRGPNGDLQEDLQKFPAGMGALSQYLHSRSMYLGVETDSGNSTREGKPGSLNFQYADAQTFAGWQLDYLLLETSNIKQTVLPRYSSMGQYLNRTGRHIFLAFNNLGLQDIPTWGYLYGNSWRTTEQTQDSWSSMIAMINRQVLLWQYAGKGNWNDAGLLTVGRGGLSFNEETAQFVMWVVLKSPLILNCPLETLTPQQIDLLGNEQLLRISDDQLGQSARRIRRDVLQSGIEQVWTGPLSGSRIVIVFFNQASVDRQITVSLKDDVKLPTFSSVSERDPIRHVNLGISSQDTVTAKVSSHSVEVRVLKIYRNALQSVEFE